MESLVFAALIGHASGHSFDGDVDISGRGSAGQIDLGIRVHRNVSVGAFFGRAGYDAQPYDPLEGNTFAVRERLRDVGLRAAIHVGPCFVAGGLGGEIGTWSGQMSLHELELGCSYDHIEVAYLATHAVATEYSGMTLTTSRFLVGVAF